MAHVRPQIAMVLMVASSCTFSTPLEESLSASEIIASTSEALFHPRFNEILTTSPSGGANYEKISIRNMTLVVSRDAEQKNLVTFTKYSRAKGENFYNIEKLSFNLDPNRAKSLLNSSSPPKSLKDLYLKANPTEANRFVMHTKWTKEFIGDSEHAFLNVAPAYAGEIPYTPVTPYPKNTEATLDGAKGLIDRFLAVDDNQKPTSGEYTKSYTPVR